MNQNSQVDIFKPMRFGKEVFHARHSDAGSFVMDWTLDPGGSVPVHYHEHMHERFEITAGTATFTVNGEKMTKSAGEELFVPKRLPHGIRNAGTEVLAIKVTYTPCADTHRMFEILTVLNEEKPGSMINMLKYFYLVPRLGLREFSRIDSPVAMRIMETLVTLMGKVSGWDKLIARFS